MIIFTLNGFQSGLTRFISVMMALIGVSIIVVRTGQDRTGQDRTGQDRTGFEPATRVIPYLTFCYYLSDRLFGYVYQFRHLTISYSKIRIIS